MWENTGALICTSHSRFLSFNLKKNIKNVQTMNIPHLLLVGLQRKRTTCMHIYSKHGLHTSSRLSKVVDCSVTSRIPVKKEVSIQPSMHRQNQIHTTRNASFQDLGRRLGLRGKKFRCTLSFFITAWLYTCVYVPGMLGIVFVIKLGRWAVFTHGWLKTFDRCPPMKCSVYSLWKCVSFSGIYIYVCMFMEEWMQTNWLKWVATVYVVE